MRRLALALVLLAVAACGGGGDDSGDGGGDRPTTEARLAVVSPVAGATIGTDVEVVLRLEGAKIVKATSKDLRPDRGHVHLLLDGKLVSMTEGLTQVLTGLKPGGHSIQAEFVASDHGPFANRVVVSVLVNVA